MSLDKWLKDEEEDKKDETQKRQEQARDKKTEKTKQKNDLEEKQQIVNQKKDSDKKSQEIKENETTGKAPKKKFSFTKFKLKCKNCKYEKTLVKRKLSEKDKLCPRCKSPLKATRL